ncbi:uncharacterized protein BJ212DRAFT_1488275 [Suillus subaureus]|uniref:Uncharacterized protein n=1 Tax=Suillus subaureus TaxID=48587 RepID=A0A9P7DP06_9AGAM|nr:uncharacterized protein BJ212DRAFT_1488275 [Suillus subaureus]KAG1799599.1 hypothetical protein BJ212DRAFT_1488275 [Suillus subaureus]
MNLVAKSLICELNTKSGSSTDPELDKLTRNIEIEDTQMADEDPNKDQESKDDDGGWVDELQLLKEAECKELIDSICLVKPVLVKLWKLAFKIIHSMTIILPVWKQVIKDLDLNV